MSWTRCWFAICAVITLAACDVPPSPAPGPSASAPPATAQMTPDEAARAFISVVRTMEPVAERECRNRTQGINCDYLIVVDDRPNQPPNAFQTRDETGRPIIAFTIGLIAEARNRDEIAFVMGHEAAHHILGHLDRQQQNAAAGAVILPDWLL